MSNPFTGSSRAFSAARLREEFVNPPREFTQIPFWFWNDDLDEAEILRQIEDFQAHGVHGFVIHARVGLPRDISWMSAKYLGYVRFAVAEAAKRSMYVILYDEGMYPSGSSCGQVVAEDPAFAVRGLEYFITEDSNPELPEGHHLVAVNPHEAHGLIAVVDRPIQSVIRGLHYIGEGPDEDTPPAGDLLNPEAMQCFIRLVYDGYYKALKEYFGTTVIGIFTDEPSLTGRLQDPAAKRIAPGTTGIIAWVSDYLGYDFVPHLSALWFDDVPDALRHRTAYHRALSARLEETYYRPLHDWCEAHGVALMGHPEGPDEIGVERYFHVPGQDLVWRWVLPNQATALEGPQSTQAKCSSSAMVHGGRRRNSNEYCGAYGHEFTFEEMRWLTDWLLVRGVNLLVPHAFYYSVRGPRWDERPPDVGPNSAWWSTYKAYADYCSRLSWLNTDSVQRCEVAILGEADHLPWRAAKVCFENQLDFNYLESCLLKGEAQVDSEGIRLGDMHYRVLIIDGEEPHESLKPYLNILEASGRLVRFDSESVSDFAATLHGLTESDFKFHSPNPGLRVRHVSKGDREFIFLFNEGPDPVTSELTISLDNLEIWDPWTGEAKSWNSRDVRLGSFQTLLLSGVK